MATLLAMNLHDNGYKILFSNLTIFRQLIETFVDEPWVADLDFSEAETVDKSFIDDHYKSTESDLIYRIGLQDSDIYIYVLLEFQSTVDKFMAVRVLHYVTSLYMDLIRSGQKFEKLPPIFPIVLYNGDRRWTAPVNIKELIEQEPSLGQYSLNFEYFKIAENEFSQEQLLRIRNIVSTLFLTESHYDINLLIAEFLNIFENEEDKQAASLLLNWFHQLRVHKRIDPSDYDKLKTVVGSTEEVKAMLITAIEKEHQEILEQGIEQGTEQGIEQGRKLQQIDILKQLLQMRFGEIPEGMLSVLSECTLDQLQSLFNPALEAESLTAFMAHIELPNEDSERDQSENDVENH